MAPPRFFSGQSARRMENIRGLRRENIARQTGRALGAAGIGMSGGAGAAAQYLASTNPEELRRQQFYQQLEAASGSLALALKQQNEINTRNLRRLLAETDTLRNIYSTEADLARTNADISRSLAMKRADMLLDQNQQRIENSVLGNESTQGTVAGYLGSLGIGGDGQRTGTGTGRRGGATEAEYKATIEAIGPRDIFRAKGTITQQDVADLVAGIRSGSVMVTQQDGAPVEASGAGTSLTRAALVANLARDAGMDQAAQIALLREVGVQGNDDRLRAILQRGESFLVGFSPEDFPPDLQAQRRQIADQRMATAPQNTGNAVADAASSAGLDPQVAERSLGLSNEGFLKLLERKDDNGNALFSPADQANMTRFRVDKIGEVVAAAEAILRQTGETTDPDQLNQAVIAINQMVTPLGINAEAVWEKARLASPNQAIREAGWNDAVAANTASMQDRQQEFYQEPLDALDRAFYADADSSPVKQALQALRDSSESMMLENETARALTDGVIAGDPEATRALQDLRGIDEGAYEAVLGTYQRQAEDDEAVREAGFTNFLGMEVPTAELPDPNDLGAMTIYMWQKAAEFPQHPPLQQAIREQMDSPEFAQWMESRGYVGQPTSELFREFQREYRQVRRSNAIMNRRQRRLIRTAQERLGMGEEESKALAKRTIKEREQPGVYTRRGTRDYRRQTREDVASAIRQRQEQQARESQAQRQEAIGGPQPTIVGRSRQASLPDETQSMTDDTEANSGLRLTAGQRRMQPRR